MSDLRSVAEVVDVVDPEPWLAILAERFGIPRRIFADHLVFRARASGLSIARRDLELPRRPEPAAVGIPFFYFGMRHPRPTSAAAIRFGAHAERNVVDLDERRVTDFVFGREIPLRDEDAARVDGAGYVLGRYRGNVIGLGHCREDEEGGLVLKGMVPKSWASQLDDPGLTR